MDNIDNLLARIGNELEAMDEGVQRDESMTRLQELAKEYRGDDRVVHIEEIAQEVENEPEQFCMKTGWEEFDTTLGGLYEGQLVTVSGMTKHGKTSFCIDLSARLKDFNPLWFLMEELPREIARKFLERGERPPNMYVPRKNIDYDLSWLEERIVESMVKNGTRIVFIDHLDYLVPLQGEARHLAIGDTVRALKQLCIKWNITIVLICHLRKTELTTSPDLNELRGSGSIAQLSDTVIIIWRETRKEGGMVVIENNTNVSIQANRRHGRTGNIRMVNDDGKYKEHDWRTDYEEEAAAEDAFKGF